MKKTATFRLVYFLLFILTTTSSFSTNYTWTGTTNTSWTTATNWTPNGAPAESDSVTIVSASNNPQLSGNRGVHRLVINGGTLDLNGDSLTVYGSSLFTSGQVDNGQLILHGTADFTGTQIGSGVYATCTTASLSGSRFISPIYMEVSSACTGNGGNTFDGTFTYKVTGSGVFTLAAMLGDTYNSTTEFHNNGVAILDIAAAGINKFNGDVSLYSNGGKVISFGSAGGSTELANGYTLSTHGTFNCVYLNLTGFYQQGNTPQNISITGYTTVNLMQTVWDGSLQLTAPGILLRGNTFNGTTEFNKTGSILNQCDGDNAYFQNASFKCSGSDGWRLATRAADTYHAAAMFESVGGARLEVAYWGDNSIRGDLTVISPNVFFGSDNGTLVFDGTLPQAINGNATATVHKMTLNKPTEHVTLNTSIDIRGSVTFVQGNLISTTTNIITFLAGSQAIGASNSSFVSGPVKKVGDTAFEFPVGKIQTLSPIQISAPSAASSSFTAEYFNDSIAVNKGLRDSTLGYILRNTYWQLLRTTGNDTVHVSLSWTQLPALSDSFLTIASWNGQKWTNLGPGPLVSGSPNSYLTSNITSQHYQEFALAYSMNNYFQNPPCACQDVQNVYCLEWCLYLFGGNEINVTADINLDATGSSGTFPLPVRDGLTLAGKVGAAYLPWWHPDCPLVYSNRKTWYNPNNIKSMFLFSMENGSTIKSLRIRGGNTDWKDYNLDNYLCGGILVKQYHTPNTDHVIIDNCNISNFSYAAVFKEPKANQVYIKIVIFRK